MGREDSAFDDLRVTIGSNIRDRRIQKGWTQSQLSEALDITIEHLRGVEGGYRTASLRLLFEVTCSLQCDLVALVTPISRPARQPGRPRKRSSTD